MPTPMQPKPRREQLLNAAASSATGAAVIFLTNPLDCLKQRWQVAPTALTTTRANAGLLGFGGEIVASEGFVRGLWLPGLAANCCACSISVGTRLGLYPQLRDAIGQPAQGGGGGVFSGLLSGLAGGALGYVVAAPLFYASRVAHAEAGRSVDTAAEPGRPARLSAAARRSSLHLLACIGEDGIGALWRGASVLVARGAVMSATQLATYDASKKALTTTGGLREGPTVHALASFAASLVLTTAICPLDVVLTRFQAGPLLGQPFKTPLQAFGTIVGEGGALALFRGWGPLWARFLPSSLLTFVIYEQARRLLVGNYMD